MGLIKREKLYCVSAVMGRRNLGREGRGLERGPQEGIRANIDCGGRREGDGQRRRQGGRGPGVGAPGVQCDLVALASDWFVHASVTALSGATTQR